MAGEPDSALKTELERSLRSWSGVRLALLFGSRARGDAHEGSDIDVAVLGASDIAALAGALEARLGARVDVVDLGSDLPLVLLEELLEDGVCVYEDEPGCYASWRARSLWAVETDGPMLKRASRAWLERVAKRGFR